MLINSWLIILSIILLIIIIKKIINLNKPFNEKLFIEKYNNYKKLEGKINLKNIKESVVNYKKITCKQTLKELKSHFSEARLVQLLEQKGIGRPSTFSSLVEKIQERNYVQKQNVEGKKLEVIDYILLEDNIVTEKGTKEFGNEKNKLLITQMGIFVIEFLIKYFNDLFDYTYTKSMEDELDNIACGKKKYYDLCHECNSFITSLINSNNLSIKCDSNLENGEKLEKLTIKIDAKHTYLIGKNRPTTKFTKEESNIVFISNGFVKIMTFESLSSSE